MNATARPPRPYVKSTRSGGSGGNCVEWAHTPAGVYIRDSKHPDGDELLLTVAEWSTLVNATINGDSHPWIVSTPVGVELVHPGGRLGFTHAEWSAFEEGARAGECVQVV